MVPAQPELRAHPATVVVVEAEADVAAVEARHKDHLAHQDHPETMDKTAAPDSPETQDPTHHPPRQHQATSLALIVLKPKLAHQDLQDRPDLMVNPEIQDKMRMAVAEVHQDHPAHPDPEETPEAQDSLAVQDNLAKFTKHPAAKDHQAHQDLQAQTDNQADLVNQAAMASQDNQDHPETMVRQADLAIQAVMVNQDRQENKEEKALATIVHLPAPLLAIKPFNNNAFVIQQHDEYFPYTSLHNFKEQIGTISLLSLILMNKAKKRFATRIYRFK